MKKTKNQKQKTTLSEQFQNPINKIAERGKFDTPYTDILDRSHF